MSMRTLEAAILVELQRVTGKHYLRNKHILSWSTGDEKAAAGELLLYLPTLQVHVVYTDPRDSSTPR